MPSTRNLLAVSLFVLGATSGVARAIIVGDPAGSPADSPANHVDPNVTTSPYGGVVGIDVAGLGPGSGVLLRTSDPTHSYVLTAAHVVNNGGVVANSAVNVSVNYSGARSTQLGVLAIHINPAYYVNQSSGNDDLAVLQLSGTVPAGVPTYNLYRTLSTVGDPIRTVTMVGYGQSGNGVSGVTIGADTSVKRFGQNRIDLLGGDDEGGPLNEVFAFDFDRPNGTNGPSGGPSLGNATEVTFGVGDSGGPAFVTGTGGELLIYGINTFGLNGDNIGGSASDTFPLFGSGGGGQIVSAYTSFIDQNSVPEPGTASVAVTAGLLALGRRRRRGAAGDCRS